MGTTLDKTVTRNSGNTVAIDTNYSELNTKADAIVEDVVSHVEAQLATTETALQTAEGLVDTKIASLLSVGDTGYTKDVVDVNLANQINALAPYSGYTQVSKKLDNFVFKEDANFTYSVADKNRFVKFGDTVVDTYGEEITLDLASALPFTTEILELNNGVLSVSGGTGYIKIPTTFVKNSLVTVNFSTTSQVVTAFYSGSSSIGAADTIESNSLSKFYVSDCTDYILVRVANESGYEYSISNISVKEIQTADFTNTAPTVTEIITDGSNSTSGAVAKGEYVLDGRPLRYFEDFNNTLGAFIDNSSGSGYVTQNINSITLNRTSSSDVGRITTADTYQENEAVYHFRIEILNVSGTGVNLLNATDLVTTSGSNASVGVWEGYATTRYANTGIGIFPYNTGTVEIGSFNAYIKSDTFQAIEDAPLGTALTNTAYFQDKTKIGVTHQSLAYHAYNTITSAYEGIKTEVLLTDTNAGDTTKEVMLANGFSEVSEFLYSKGSYLCLPVGLAQMLNSGAYHPFLNNSGTKWWAHQTNNNDAYKWWLETYKGVLADSSSDCFIDDPMLHQDYLGDITGGHSLHPQSKFYDIIYSDQFKDLREYAKIANKYEIELLREDKRVNSCVDEVVMFGDGYGMNAAYGGGGNLSRLIGAFDNSVMYPTSNTNDDSIKTIIFYTDGSFVEYYNGYQYNGGLRFDTDSALSTNLTVDFLISIKTNPIISSNTKLSIDLIGSPDNYPDVVKTRLASGVGINGVYPLLVSDEGVSMLPDGTTKSYKFMNKSLESNNVVQSNTPTISWSTVDVIGLGSYSYINNSDTITSFPSTYLRLYSYTSNNAPYQITDPKPVLEVTPKAIASNSHSIYKGGDIASQISGKITVGNGTNGYESKVLENAENLYFDFYVYADGEVFNYEGGKTYLFDGFDNYNGVYVATDTNAVYASTSLAAGYGFIQVSTTPQHPTLTLDANDGAKWFEVLEEDENGNVYAGVYGEEMVYDTTFGDGDDFAQLTNGTDIDLNGNTVKTFHGSNPLNIKMK